MVDIADLCWCRGQGIRRVHVPTCSAGADVRVRYIASYAVKIAKKYDGVGMLNGDSYNSVVGVTRLSVEDPQSGRLFFQPWVRPCTRRTQHYTGYTSQLYKPRRANPMHSILDLVFAFVSTMRGCVRTLRVAARC